MQTASRTLCAVDVDYRDRHAVAACVVFDAWAAPTARREHTVVVDDIAPYEPGAFYKRELPCLLAVLKDVDAGVVVVDSYVWLDAGKPGLGARLHAERGGVVVGVAKKHYAGAPGVEVLRGTSTQPLYVTAAGVDVEEAAGWVRAMHGPHRFPTLLKRVDALCRAG